MPVKKRLAILCVLTMFSFSLTAVAEDDIFSYSLDQLLQITIASKTSEKSSNAPGVVSVITKQDIQSYGARNLRDVLDRHTNMQVIGSNLYPHNRLSIRGVTQTHTDNKVLVLLNGKVVRDANQGGLNSDIYNLFPVNIIERIEVIRGPGSALYGTNAFSGVINIITDKQTNTVSFRSGSFNHKEVSAQVAFGDKDNGGQVTINSMDTNGDEFETLMANLAQVVTYILENELFNYWLKATLMVLTLTPG